MSTCNGCRNTHDHKKGSTNVVMIKTEHRAPKPPYATYLCISIGSINRHSKRTALWSNSSDGRLELKHEPI